MQAGNRETPIRCEIPVKWSNEGLLWTRAAGFCAGSVAVLGSMLQCKRELEDAAERKACMKVL